MVVGVLRVEGDLRQQPSLHQIDIVARRLLVEGSGEDVGVDPLGHRKGVVEGFRRQCRKLRKAQGPRRVADDPDVIGDRSGEICLRRGQRRARQRQARLRLRHIGAGDLADIEARLRRLELLGQHLDILLPELQDVAVANHVHIGGGAVEQNLLLDRQQPLTTGVDQGFGAVADRLEAAETGCVSVTATPAGAVRVGLLMLELFHATPASPLAETVGRQPESACGTASSVARCRARSALSVGLPI